MMQMTTSAAQKAKVLISLELLVLSFYWFDQGAFFNIQTAALSSFFIMIASMHTYKKMVKKRLEAGIYEEDRDPLEKIDDPHGLYDETPINEAPPEELDLKSIVKEEKKRVKILNPTALKYGFKGGFSLYRLGAYLFLVLAFIALKNNRLLQLEWYLPSLVIGIFAGYFVMKENNDG